MPILEKLDFFSGKLAMHFSCPHRSELPCNILRQQGGGSPGVKKLLGLIHIQNLSEATPTLFTESKKLAALTIGVRQRFRKYRGFHIFREL